MTPRAQLFLDETGSFSSPDDFRLVGGLLVVADRDVESDLRQLHDAAAATIAWPVRLHAFELVRPGPFLASWYRTAGAGATFLGAREHATLDRWARRWTVPSPAVRGHRWAGKPAPVAGTAPDRKLEGEVRAIGHAMFGRVRASLRKAFAAWCNDRCRAYVIAGHVDDKVPPGQRAYDAALGKALTTSWGVAEPHGPAKLEVHVARWSDDVRHTPAALARDLLGDRAVVEVAGYDDCTPGVWLADSLLAWLRGPPGSIEGILLTDVQGGQACVRAGSSGGLPELRPVTKRYTALDHYVAAVQRTDELLCRGRVS